MNRAIQLGNSDWQLSANQISLRIAAGEVRLYPVKPIDVIFKAPVQLAPSLFCLREWTDYRLRVDISEKPDVVIGSTLLKADSDGLFSLRYENYIGQSLIQIRLTPHQTITLPIEVLSPKYPTPEKHQVFYQTLLTQLYRRAVQLPFAISAPTQVMVNEAPMPPSPLFVYNFFRSYGPAIRTALEMIIAEPHRQLTDEQQWLPLPQATEIGPEVVLAMLAHPEYLVKASPDVIAIAAYLNGQAPTQVWQRLPRETFDTPENRFVRACLAEFLRWLEILPTISWWSLVPQAAKIDLRGLTGHLGQIRRDPLFDEVGQMVVFPAASQVLLRRDGYRELLQLWRLFQLARRPFFVQMQTAIELRDVATLYEFWCFYELIAQLSATCGSQPSCWIEVTDNQGLKYEARAGWATFGQLVYNRTFGHRSGSYSVSLRPDFVFYPAQQIGLKTQPFIFDAKFRFSYSEWTADDDDTPDRLAKRVDLYKMHTYRDALKAKTAVVLYPGNTPIFYSLTGEKITNFTLLDTLTTEGIGVIEMEPGKD